MRRHINILSLLVLLISAMSANPVFANDNKQFAVYNYRNDNHFNAFLNHDIDSITFSCIDTLGIEHDEVVVQEVWTPDSVFRIPLSAIDSLAFRAPAPKVRDGLFYLRDYHADRTLGVDSLTVYFSTSISNDSLPSVGQVMVTDTDRGPFEEGFAGRVAGVTRHSDRIEVVCEAASVHDVFERLVVVGTAVSDLSEYKLRRKSSNLKGYWDEFEAGDAIREIEVPGEWECSFLDIFTVKTEDPVVECRYYVLVNPWDYYIDADVYIHHNNLTYSFTFDWDKIRKYGKEYAEVKKVWEMLKDGDIDKIQAAEAELEEKAWEKKFKVPFKAGLFNFSIEFGAFIKPLAVNLKLSYVDKTSAFQHIGLRLNGYMNELAYLAAVANSSSLSEALSLEHHNVEGAHTFTQFPSKSVSWDLKIDGSVSTGIFAKFNVSFISKHLIRASVGAEGGVKLSGTLDLKLKDSDYEEPSFYSFIKDTNIDAKLYVKFNAEAGALPFSLLKLAWEKEKALLEGNFYFVPSFTKPALTTDIMSWGNNRMNNETFLTTVSRDLFPLLSCYPGLGFYSKLGDKWDYEEALYYDPNNPYRYEIHLNENLDREVGLSAYGVGLKGGDTYRCYPIFNMFGFTFMGAPYTEFTYPKPLSVENPSLMLLKNDSRLVRIIGGWGDYDMTCDKPDVIRAELQTSGNFTQVKITALKSGTATITVRDPRSIESTTIAVKVLGEVEDGTAITVSTEDLEYGPLAYGMKETKSFTVTNHGTVDLQFFVRNGNKGFSVEEEETPQSLQPGASKAFNVKAMGVGKGHYRHGVLYIYSNATQFPVAVGLKVTGDSLQAQYVDLGLSVKWAAFNLGAIEPCDANAGEYFAWGETDSKSSYSWENYSHCDGTGESCHALGDISGTDNDAAQYHWGKGWRIPTEDEFRELQGQCTWTWDETGFYKGYWVKGPNGNRIFLEAAGCNEGTEPADVNLRGIYYTSTPSKTNSQASYMLIFGTESNVVNPGYRYVGASIRPVYSEESADTTIIIDEHENDYVDLDLPSGTLWATINVGASAPEELGCSFAWGESTPKDLYDWSTYKWCNGDYNNLTKYCTLSNYGIVDNKIELDPEDDAARKNWGAAWKMPTYEQFKELTNQDNCSFQWVTKNGVKGKLITSKRNGASLFLPAVMFWSSSLITDEPSRAYALGVYQWYFVDQRLSRERGQYVRAVRVKQKEEHEYVDLGLPSGTLWATMNIGATSPEDYGDYFSWGDTSPKNYYDWSTCNWCDGVFSFTKYNDTDGKTELDPEDDAATANWGAMWHMPSKEQIIELIDNCTCLWTEKNGVKGQLLISKINGASLFFPAGGNAGGGSHYNVGTKGWFLSRTIEGWFAYSLQITSSGANLDHYGRRELGFPVRAVRVSQK